MGTHCLIALRYPDGTAQSIVCYCDGYPSHAGPVLLNHFNTFDKVRELVCSGDVSSISSEGVPILTLIPCTIHENLNDLAYCLESYNYLFDGHQWILFDRIENNDAFGVRIELCT